MTEISDDICFDCAKAGAFRIPQHDVNQWEATCSICGEKKRCAAPRNFGYPNTRARERARRIIQENERWKEASRESPQQVSERGP